MPVALHGDTPLQVGTRRRTCIHAAHLKRSVHARNGHLRRDGNRIFPSTPPLPPRSSLGRPALLVISDQCCMSNQSAVCSYPSFVVSFGPRIKASPTACRRLLFLPEWRGEGKESTSNVGKAPRLEACTEISYVRRIRDTIAADRRFDLCPHCRLLLDKAACESLSLCSPSFGGPADELRACALRHAIHNPESLLRSTLETSLMDI